MKATIRDLGILSQIRPLELAAYLRVNGWQVSEETNKATYWTQRTTTGESFEVLLPRRREVADFAQRISEALQTLEAAENRSQLEILDDLSTANADVVRIRTHPRDGDSSGSIALEDGVLVFERVRDMVLAAASATVNRRALFARRKPAKAVSYMQKVRMGQTERGSYVITLISPVAPTLSLNSAEVLTTESEEPFEREALTTLALAIEATRNAAERATVTGQLAPFRAAVEHGVSANLCEALVGLSEGGGNHDVEISFSWSRSRTAPRDVPQRVVIPQDTISIIGEAARVFRETDALDDFEVSGGIVKLERIEGAPTGKITVVAQVDDKPRRITIELPEILYHEAVKAHDEQAPILCYGELVKEGNTFTLRNPRDFEILSDS
jgi:hypothetical protein